jgi:hypothetical protein
VCVCVVRAAHTQVVGLGGQDMTRDEALYMERQLRAFAKEAQAEKERDELFEKAQKGVLQHEVQQQEGFVRGREWEAREAGGTENAGLGRGERGGMDVGELAARMERLEVLVVEMQASLGRGLEELKANVAKVAERQEARTENREDD